MADTDLSNAIAGRLGHVDPVYTDPAYSDVIDAAPPPEQHTLAEQAQGRPKPAKPAPEPVHATPEPSGEAEVVEAPAEEPEGEDLEGFTVAELKEELDALGIEYDPKARKAELVELVRQAESDS